MALLMEPGVRNATSPATQQRERWDELSVWMLENPLS